MRDTSTNEHDRRIAAMFDRVAPRYDFLNRTLSFGQDLAWRRRAIRLAALPAGGRALDIGAGTGDLALALLSADPDARVVAVDLSAVMLDHYRERAGREGVGPRALAVLATTEGLPFPDASVDRIVSGFTVRNVANLPLAFAELKRVLRPGGRAVILELSHPYRAFAPLYHLYFDHVAPRLAVLLGGDAEAHRYLPRSLRAFPDAGRLAGLLREAGFADVRVERLTLGIAAIHVAER